MNDIIPQHLVIFERNGKFAKNIQNFVTNPTLAVFTYQTRENILNPQ